MRLTLIKKKHEAKDVISFLFKPEIPFSWKSGQFLHYTLKHQNPDSRGRERYFTISAAPFEDIVMLTTRFTPRTGSSFKKALRSLKIGDVIEAVGPDGNFTVTDPKQKMVFIAGGIGITPFRSMLLDLDHQNLPIYVTLLYANKTPDFPYKEELERVAKNNRNLKIYYFVSPKRIDEGSIKTVSNLQEKIFYVSGPELMVESFDKMLREMGVSKSHVKKDFFPGYSDR